VGKVFFLPTFSEQVGKKNTFLDESFGGGYCQNFRRETTLQYYNTLAFSLGIYPKAFCRSRFQQRA